MEQINFFQTTEKLFLIARALDDILMDSCPQLLHGTDIARSRTLDAIVTGVHELHHGLEAMVMAENRCIPED